jgi:hypothetical protein
MTSERKSDPPVCSRCYGRGAIELEETHRGIPITKPCVCVLAKDVLKNLDRAWSGLSTAPRITESPLADRAWKNTYITATEETFRTHLKHMALRQGRNYGLVVCSDATLMTAWLASAALAGKEILDPDAATVSLEKATLVDLVDPPDLLVIRLGVKSARNSAMPEVLLEALAHRSHVGKPTWICDQPTKKLDPSHISFSPDVADFLRGWDHFALDNAASGLAIDMIGTGAVPNGTGAPGGLTLSAAHGLQAGSTHRVDRETREAKPKRKFRGEGA